MKLYLKDNITVILIVNLCIQYTNQISVHYSFTNYSDKHQVAVKSDAIHSFVPYCVTSRQYLEDVISLPEHYFMKVCRLTGCQAPCILNLLLDRAEWSVFAQPQKEGP